MGLRPICLYFTCSKLDHTRALQACCFCARVSNFDVTLQTVLGLVVLDHVDNTCNGIDMLIPSDVSSCS